MVIDLDHVTRCHPVAAVLLDAVIDEVVRRGRAGGDRGPQGPAVAGRPAEFPTRAEALAHLAGTT